MWLNAKESFTEIDKDRNVEGAIGGKMAEKNPVELRKVTRERMHWQSKSLVEERFENNNFVRIGVWETLTSCRAPSGRHLVRLDVVDHHLLQI